MGCFETEDHRDRFLAEQRRDRDVAATRVLTRTATYTPWGGPDTACPTSEQEREALLAEHYEEIFGRTVPGPGTDRG